jgi:hypothetical protein
VAGDHDHARARRHSQAYYVASGESTPTSMREFTPAIAFPSLSLCIFFKDGRLVIITLDPKFASFGQDRSALTYLSAFPGLSVYALTHFDDHQPRRSILDKQVLCTSSGIWTIARTTALNGSIRRAIDIASLITTSSGMWPFMRASGLFLS